MEERKWILGDDLAACDNLLDGITFDDVILAVHCNCRVISRETVTKQFFEILEQRLLDMNELFNALSDEQKVELHCTGFSELDSMMAQWLV